MTRNITKLAMLLAIAVSTSAFAEDTLSIQLESGKVVEITNGDIQTILNAKAKKEFSTFNHPETLADGRIYFQNPTVPVRGGGRAMILDESKASMDQAFAFCMSMNPNFFPDNFTLGTEKGEIKGATINLVSSERIQIDEKSGNQTFTSITCGNF